MNPSSETLQRAKQILDDIGRLSGEMAALFGGAAVPVLVRRRGRPPGRTKQAANPAPAPTKRRMSAARRARIAAAQKARWAKVHGERARKAGK